MTFGLTMGSANAAYALQPFTKPAGFSWDYTSEFSVLKRGRKYYTDFNADTLSAPSGNTYYVDPSATGTADGSSYEDAFTTIEAALGATNAAKIILAPGYYNWIDSGWQNNPPGIARDTAMICENGKAILHTSHENVYSWIENATYPGVYETTYNAIYEVVDLTDVNERGYPIPLTRQTSIANVGATPGSYIFSGSTLYVHTHDSRTADNDILAFRQKTNMDIRGTYNMYFENIEFWSGTYPLIFNQYDGDEKHIVCKNCAALYGPFGGFHFRDISRVSMINCHAEYNELDGFAYRMNNYATQTNILEVNCTAYNNGIFDQNNNYDNISDGSAIYDGVYALRLNGYYGENDGGQITDTHTGSQSLNLGAICGESLSSTQESLTDTGFRAASGAQLWLENTSAFGSYYNRVNAGSTLTDLGGFKGNGIGGDNGTVS